MSFTPTPEALARTEQLWMLDQAHLWHPFTQMQLWPSDAPLIIERGEGNWLIDTLGRRWLDGISSLWVTVHGHHQAALDAAVRAQLEKVAHCTLLGQASVPSIELAAKLVQLTPEGLEKVFYSDNGSTSVEVALKMAYQYWRQSGRPEKRRFAALEEAYHGDTLGSVSVGGIELFHERFEDLLFDVERLPAPHRFRKEGEARALQLSLEAAERLLTSRAHELAALVVEPMVQGAAGMWMQPKGYLRGLAELCEKHEVLLVCDEVATGFGRTGTMFAVEQEGVSPDFLCLAKGITGGYLPLAVTMTTKKVFDAFLGTAAEGKTFFHGHTYTGNPLACAAALANLELFETEQTLAKMKPAVDALSKGLERIARLAHVGEVRRRGLMVGVELVKDKATQAEYDYGERMGFQVCQAARTHGVLLRPLGNVVVMMPPLSLTVDEAQLLCKALEAAITATLG